jgi:hypothetical protein
LLPVGKQFDHSPAVLRDLHDKAVDRRRVSNHSDAWVHLVLFDVSCDCPADLIPFHRGERGIEREQVDEDLIRLPLAGLLEDL